MDDDFLCQETLVKWGISSLILANDG